MKYFYLKNSNEHNKNMFPHIERYVTESTRGISPYKFVHDNDTVFSVFADDNNLNVIHKMGDPDNFRSEPYPYKALSFEYLGDLMDKHGSVHLLAVDVPTIISDQDLLAQAVVAVQDVNGNFVNPDNMQPISNNVPTVSLLLISGYKVGPLPCYLMFLHVPFLAAKVSADRVTDTHTIKTIQETETIKKKIFSCEMIQGTEATIGNNISFCNADEIVIKVFNDELSPMIGQVDLSTFVTVNSPVPHTLDHASGVIRIDMSGVPKGQSIPLTIDLESHDFLKTWVYHTQRFNYQYMIYKMV